MYSPELNSESFKGDSWISTNLKKRTPDLKHLDFHLQTYYLSQLIFNRARLLYNDENKAGQLIDMLNELAADDFYDIVDIMQDDSVLRKWIDEFMELAVPYK